MPSREIDIDGRTTSVQLWTTDSRQYTYCLLLLGHPTLVGKASSFTLELSFFFLFSSIHRAQQPCRERPSNVFRRFGRIGKASSIDIGILPNFHGGQKVRNLASFETSFNFEPPAFENAARYPNSETKVQCCDDRPISWPSLVKLGPRSPEKALSVLTHRLKSHVKTR